MQKHNKKFLQKHYAKKSLGQNFLQDSSVCDKIVESCIEFSSSFLKNSSLKNKTVVEVGPGHGILTEAILCHHPQKLVAIEKDDSLATALQQKYQKLPNIEIINADALKFDFNKHITEQFIIIANLPYNISTEMLCHWLCDRSLREKILSMGIMMQKEVVERVVAAVNTKQYGKLSVLCQLLAKVEKGFDIGPEYFYPPPKVTSSILHVSPKKIFDMPTDDISSQINDEELKFLQRLLQAAFSARRKKIKTALNKFISSEGLDELQISQDIRPEDVSIEKYIQIVKYCLGDEK